MLRAAAAEPPIPIFAFSQPKGFVASSPGAPAVPAAQSFHHIPQAAFMILSVVEKLKVNVLTTAPNIENIAP